MCSSLCCRASASQKQSTCFEKSWALNLGSCSLRQGGRSLILNCFHVMHLQYSEKSNLNNNLLAKEKKKEKETKGIFICRTFGEMSDGSSSREKLLLTVGFSWLCTSWWREGGWGIDLPAGVLRPLWSVWKKAQSGEGKTPARKFSSTSH